MSENAATSGHFLIVQADFYSELAAAQKQGAIAALAWEEAMRSFPYLVHLRSTPLLLQQRKNPAMTLLLLVVLSGVRQLIMKLSARNHLAA